MLSIFINDQALELGSDFSITFNFLSSIFNNVGTYSYPITIPFTIRNAGILNFKHRVENTGDPYQEFPCKIIVDGRSLTGLFKCTIGNKGTFEGSIYAIEGDFFYAVKDTFLHNMDYGRMYFADNTEAENWINGCWYHDYPDQPCAFPRMLDDTYFEDGVNPYHYFNDISDTPNNRITKYITGSGNEQFLNTIVPFLYLKYVLKKMFTGLGYDLDNKFFDSHSDFNKLVIFNCVNLNSDYTFFPCGILRPVFNYHLPLILVNDFIKGIETNWNLRFFINSNTNKASLLSLRSIVENPEFVEFSKNIISKSIEPEDKLKGYLLKMTLDDGDASYDTLKNVEQIIMNNLKGAVSKISDLPRYPNNSPFEIRFVFETGLYYQIVNGEWTVLDNQTLGLYSQYPYLDASQSIESTFSTLVQPTGVISCLNKQSEWNKITPRTFFTEKNAEHLWNPNIWGKFSTDNFSLWYKGETGIFEKQWKSFLNWRMSTKCVKTTKQLAWNEILDLDFSKKYMMHGVKSLLSSVQMTVKVNSISPALIVHYPCL